MTPLDFVGFWHANPFRPFRILTASALLDVSSPLQVAMSPSMQRVTVSLDDATHSLDVADILRCEWLSPDPGEGRASHPLSPDARPAPPQIDLSRYQPDPGALSLLSLTLADGSAITHVALTDRDGNSAFSTAGTRWDIHGIERFENGASLFLHHLDDPTTQRRVLVWPGNGGSFDSFAERADAPGLNAALRTLDTQLSASPLDPAPPDHYFTSATPAPKPPPMPFRNYWELDRPEPFNASRFTLDVDDVEYGPHRWSEAIRLTDTLNKEVVLDLFGTLWDCDVSREPDSHALTLSLDHHPGSLSLHIKPHKRSARLLPGGSDIPLDFLNRHLRNFSLYASIDALRAALRAGPQGSEHPAVVLPNHHGHRIELWAGHADWPTPFLHPRILAPSGRELLDLRGSWWAALVEPDTTGSALTLRLWFRDEAGRNDVLSNRLWIDLPSRRVTSHTLPGFTTLGVIHHLAHHSRDPGYLLRDLREAFARGAALHA